MRKIMIGAWMCVLLLASCSIEDNDSSPEKYSDWDVYNSSNPNSESYGEFAINWMVDGAVVDNSLLQVNEEAKVLELPFQWLHHIIFPDAKEVKWSEGSTEPNTWDMHIAFAGYSENNYYYSIKGTEHSQKVIVDDKTFVYHVYFSQDQSISIYNKNWDAWSAITPIDSIRVSDEIAKEVVEVKRYSPAIHLSFNSTKRTKARDSGN
ncbi:MAG: hypothetical protein IKX24_10765 [Prevotella sp.]|nr:hypothetical protein [Prevotella sp.]